MTTQRTIEDDVRDEDFLVSGDLLNQYTQELQGDMTAYTEEGPFGEEGTIVEVNMDSMAEFYSEERESRVAFAEDREGVSELSHGRATDLNMGAALARAVEAEAENETQYEALEKELGMTGTPAAQDLSDYIDDASRISFEAGYNDVERVVEEAGL